MRSYLRVALVLGLTSAVTAAAVFAQRGTTSPAAPTNSTAQVTARIVASAQAVLASLDEAGRAKVQFPFEGPQKTRWSNLPSPMFHREGLRLGDLTAAQKAAVMNLLAAALSK